jgi:death on curing protein
MIRYLALSEVIDLHRQVVEQSGGSFGTRDLGALESAVAQPQMTAIVRLTSR